MIRVARVDPKQFEAMVERDKPATVKELAEAGIPFENDLAQKIECVLAMPEAEREALRRRAADIVRERYCWDAVTSAYERLLAGLARNYRKSS